MDKYLLENSQYSRYSIEVNYRSSLEEVIDNYTKITLGYVSAALKNYDYHCKKVFTKRPFRILVATRNWDDGEWIAIVMFDHVNMNFIIGEGFYDKSEKVVRIRKRNKSNAKTAAELVSEVRKKLNEIKDNNPEKTINLKPTLKKPGPKFKIPKRKKR